MLQEYAMQVLVQEYASAQNSCPTDRIMTNIVAPVAHRELSRSMASKQQRTMQRNRIHSYLFFRCSSTPAQSPLWRYSAHPSGKKPNNKDRGNVCTQNNNRKVCNRCLQLQMSKILFLVCSTTVCCLHGYTKHIYIYIFKLQ